MAISTITANSVTNNSLTTDQFASTAVHGRRNLIINGAMQVAQRGTSFTVDNVYTIDRWKSGDGTGGSPARTLSQEEFALGQTSVPNARYYLKHDQTGASTNGNASLVHKIEDVTRFDGQTVTLSFYAKADASMDIDIRFIQNFGSGGSPSSNVELNEIVSIGTSWTKYTVTKTLGSLSGKTVGTDGEHTSSLTINIDFEPTSTFTFEATLFQLEYGEQATPFEHRSFGEELQLCKRYYQKSYPYTNYAGDNLGAGAHGFIPINSLDDVNIHFTQTMRTTPTLTTYRKNGSATSSAQRTDNAGSYMTITVSEVRDNGFHFNPGSSVSRRYRIHYIADAEL